MLIQKTTIVCAPCYGLYAEVASSLSLPNSIPQGIALSVTTSDWLLCLSRAAEHKHLKWSDVQTLDKPLSARYEKVSDIISRGGRVFYVVLCHKESRGRVVTSGQFFKKGLPGRVDTSGTKKGD